MGRHRLAVAAHLWLLDTDGRILFQRRAGTGYADGSWSVPAGHVEPGETLHAACVREAAEEIAVELDEAALEFACVQHKHDTDGQERIDVFFSAQLPEGQVPRIVEHHRASAQVWRHPSEPPLPVVPYVAAALDHWLCGGGPLGYFGF